MPFVGYGTFTFTFTLPTGLTFASIVLVAVRLLAEIQSLEALDVFGMLKESTVNSLAEVLSDRKVTWFYFHVFHK